MRALRVMCLIIAAVVAASIYAQNVKFTQPQMPLHDFVRQVHEQTGKNFIYGADVSGAMTVTASTHPVALKTALDSALAGTDVIYKAKGNNIMLMRRKPNKKETVTISGYVREDITGESLIGAFVYDSQAKAGTQTNSTGFYSLTVPAGRASISVSYPGFEQYVHNIANLESNTVINVTLREAHELAEVEVIADKNKNIAMESAFVGRLNLSNVDIASTPTMFGEADVIKTLQLQPGVSAGVEGMAGLYVHGGNNDENLYMLDNIPLYQINHFGGLFSAFNTEAIKNVDFYKSSFPVKYDGRLSSILEVNTLDGSSSGHHGSVKLGLTSGAFNINGPLFSKNTTYSFALRRSWFDLVTIPAIAIYNRTRNDKPTQTIFGYSFTDLNAKINHRFSDRSTAHIMLYFGEDYLKAGNKEYDNNDGSENEKKDLMKLRWGNFVASAGWNFAFTNQLFGEFTAAYTHYRSRLMFENYEILREPEDGLVLDNRRSTRTDNYISDAVFRADLEYSPLAGHKLQFGANYTYHTFMPYRSSGILVSESETVDIIDDGQQARANEAGAYIGYDGELLNFIRVNVGAHAGLYAIGNHTYTDINPRVSLRTKVGERLSLKAAYSRMSQYITQITESCISLPTDRWVPVSGELKPQRSDKISVAGYYDIPGACTIQMELYYKWLHNVVDYSDDYFLNPTSAPWQDLLCSGSGRAKGVDVSVSRKIGKITGHASYSLLWADRQFTNKNGGHRFPARFDNRHKINFLVNWRINDKWEVNASWTGMSGNRFTLYAQDYELLDAPDMPTFNGVRYDGVLDYSSGVNNYRLPFYHRLDVGVNLHTKRGMWNFSLYNAYSYMNTISLRKMRWSEAYYPPCFERFRLLPVIPSASYTWFF